MFTNVLNAVQKPDGFGQKRWCSFILNFLLSTSSGVSMQNGAHGKV